MTGRLLSTCALLFLGGALSLCFAQNPGGSNKTGAAPALPPGVIGLGGHKDVVYSAALDPGGLSAVTASFDKTLRLWDISNGQLLRTLDGPSGHQGIILSADISPDGKWIAAGGMDQTLRIWENSRLESSPLINPPVGFSGNIASVLPGDQANQRILVGSKGELFRQSDIAKEKAIPLSTEAVPSGITGKITQATRMTSGQWAIASEKGEIAVADSNGKWIQTWQAHEGPVRFMEAGWEGLVSVGPEEAVKSWRVDATMPKVWPGTPPMARIFAGEPDKVLVGPQKDTQGDLRWIKFPSGEKVTDLPGSSATVSAAGGNGPEGPIAIVLNQANQWGIWSGMNKQAKVSFRAPATVSNLAILPGGRLEISLEGIGTQYWQPPVGETPKLLPIPGGAQKVDVLQQGRRLLVHGPGAKLRLVDPPSGRVDREINGPPGLTSISVSPDGGDFLAGLADGRLVWHRRATGDVWQPGILAHSAPIVGTLWLSNAILVTWDKTGSVKLWKAPWDNGFKAGDLPTKFAIREWPEIKGNQILTLAEVEGNILTLRDGGAMEWLWVREGKLEPVLGPAGFLPKALSLNGRRAILIDGAGKGFSRTDITPRQPMANQAAGDWQEVRGHFPEGGLGALESGNPERFALIRTVGNGQYVDLYDVKSGSVVARSGPIQDLKAAVLHPSGAQLLTILGTGIQAQPLGFEQLVSKENTDEKNKGPRPPNGSLKANSRDGNRTAWVVGRKLFLADSKGEKPTISQTLSQEIIKVSFDLDSRFLILLDSQGMARIHDGANGQFLLGSQPGMKCSDAFVFSGGQQWLLATEKGLLLLPLPLARWVPLPVGSGAVEVFGGSSPLVALPPAGINKVVGGLSRLSPADGKPDSPFATGKVWQSLSQSRTQQLIGAASGNNLALFQMDGKQVADANLDGTIRRVFFHPGRNWICAQTETHAEIFDTTKLPTPPMGEQGLRSLGRVKISKDAGVLTFGGPQSSDLFIPLPAGMHFWRIASDNPIKAIGIPAPVDSVAFDPKGRWIATGSRDGKLRLWDPLNGNKAKEITLGHKALAFQVYAVAFRPDGGAIAAAGMDRAIRIYDPQTGQLLKEFSGASDNPSADKAIKVNPPPPPSSPDGHHDAVFALAWSADGKSLASAGADRMIKVWSPAEGAIAYTLADPQIKPTRPGGPQPAHPGWVHALRYLADGTLLSAGAGPKNFGILRSWKNGQITPLERWVIPQGPLQVLVPNAKGDKILIGTGHRIKVGETEENLSLIAPLPLPGAWIQTAESLSLPDTKRRSR
jgi:WD40 repeat protein